MSAVWLIAPVVVIVGAVEVWEPLHVVADHPGEQPLVPGPLDDRGADDPGLVETITEAQIEDGFTAVCQNLVAVPIRKFLRP